MKVTVEQIREALKVCDGCVSRTARVLGIARNNLYKRLASLEMDPHDYRPRREGDRVAMSSVTAPAPLRGVAPAVPPSRRTKRAPISSNAIYPSAHGAPNLLPVDSERATAAMAIEDEQDVARRSPLRIARNIYLRPEQVKALEEACFDLAPILREKLSPSKVVERFMDDGFADWLARAKGGKPPKRARNGKRDDDEGAR